MKLMTFLIGTGYAVFLFFFILPHKIYAYLDPGTGSYIFQLILGFLLGGVFAIKIFWSKIRTFFKKLFFKKKKNETPDS